MESQQRGRWADSLPTAIPESSLTLAAGLLTEELAKGPSEWRFKDHAAAHIRAVRHELEFEFGVASSREPDWYVSGSTSKRVLWGVLAWLVEASLSSNPEDACQSLRRAEAGLRTLFKQERGNSGNRS